jgi:hypothetical protein
MRRTDAEIITALTKAKGLINLAAKALKIDPQTIRNRMKKSPKVARAAADARDLVIDVAEEKLFQAIRDREPWAIAFVLKTLGKNRGYVERVEQSGMNFNMSPQDLAKMTDAELDSYITRVSAVIGRT